MTAEKRAPGLMLLRLPRGSDEPLYIVVEQGDWGGDEFAEYAVDEGQCPTNIVPVEAFIDGEDTDPHGVLEYVQWVPRPTVLDVYPRVQDRDFWRRIFSRLPKTAEAEGEVFLSEQLIASNRAFRQSAPEEVLADVVVGARSMGIPENVIAAGLNFVPVKFSDMTLMDAIRRENHCDKALCAYEEDCTCWQEFAAERQNRSQPTTAPRP